MFICSKLSLIRTQSFAITMGTFYKISCLVTILSIASVQSFNFDQSYQDMLQNAIDGTNNRRNQLTTDLLRKEFQNIGSETGNGALQSFFKLQQHITNYRTKSVQLEASAGRAFSSEFQKVLRKTYNVSNVCMNHTLSTIQGLVSGHEWAIRVFDASGKIPSGILNGDLIWIGDYDECMAIEGVSGHDGVFKENVCAAIIPLLGQQVYLGICTPRSCSPEDFKNILTAALSMFVPENATIPAFGTMCLPEKPEVDALAIGAMIVTGFIFLCMVAGTLYDLIREYLASDKKDEKEKFEASDKTPLIRHINHGEPKVKEGILSRLLLSFSVYSNGAKILSTTQAAGSLTAINGIRFLSMSWVILGHTYVFLMSYTANARTFEEKILSRWSFQCVANAFLSVDSFFTLSGLLMAYLFFKEMKKTNGKMNWGMFYFHRFWRLTPAYMLLLFIDVALSRYFGEGPFWQYGGFEKNFCKTSWWTNLLYINNLVDLKDECFGWAWYLANDMQFFVISPLLLLPLFFWPMIGVGVCMVFLVGSWIATGVISMHYKLETSMFDPRTSLEDQQNYMQEYYVRPYARIGPYIVGLLAGYILYRTEKGLKIKQILNLIGWIVATVLGILVVYGLYGDLAKGDLLSYEVSALYNTVHRSVWGACLSWVIIACARGYGGFVNTLLSWKGFIPLSRLTYCTYLVHPLVLYTVYMSRRRLIYLTDATMVYFFLGNLFVSLALGFIASLAFESPMMGLEKVLLKRNKKS